MDILKPAGLNLDSPIAEGYTDSESVICNASWLNVLCTIVIKGLKVTKKVLYRLLLDISIKGCVKS